jgi:hypothetical protein
MLLPIYMGCLMEFYKSLSLYYKKMCFKILNFFDASQSLSQAIYFKSSVSPTIPRTRTTTKQNLDPRCTYVPTRVNGLALIATSI